MSGSVAVIVLLTVGDAAVLHPTGPLSLLCVLTTVHHLMTHCSFPQVVMCHRLVSLPKKGEDKSGKISPPPSKSSKGVVTATREEEEEEESSLAQFLPNYDVDQREPLLSGQRSVPGDLDLEHLD